MNNKIKDDLANKAQAVLDEAEGLDPSAVPDALVPSLQAGFDLAEAVLEALSDQGRPEVKKSASAAVVPEQDVRLGELRAALGKRSA